MTTIKYVHWRDGEFWLGYLQDYPVCLTQGISREDLVDHLKDLHENRDLFNSNNSPLLYPPGSPGEFTL